MCIEGLSYDEAMDEVKRGRVLRRESWGDGPPACLMSLADGDPPLALFAEDDFRDWKPTPEDMAARDWIAYGRRRSDKEADGHG